MAKKKAGKKASKKKAAKKKAAKKKASKKKKLMAAAVANKTVTFTNNNPSVLVNITVGGKQFACGTRSGSFPPGEYDLFWSSTGSGSYEVSVTGGTTFAPISGTAIDGGASVLEVS